MKKLLKIFYIPDNVVIAPQSTLVIAYYDSDNPCEYEVFKEYFYWLYNISDTDDFLFIYQDQLTLPNDTTMLVLKDSNGITRDSTVFGIRFEESPLYAPNDDAEIIYGGLEYVYSIQRTRINFNTDGTTIYSDIHWAGKNVAVHTQLIPHNSVGSVKDGIFACNIIPVETESTLQESNFILEITPRVALSNIDTALLDPKKATIKRTYYDPLYRPTLTYLYKYTPNKNNLVTLKEYDEFMRPTKEWLPISVELDALTNETFKKNAVQYYNGESRPFIEQMYSTAIWDNGITKNELVGTQKAGADMGAHKVGLVSRGNDFTEVRLFKVTSSGLLEANGFYCANALLVKQTTDEDNKTKLVYTNLRDQVVMEKIDNATTYYVYNDLNQLCYVLPPIAANQITDGTYSDDVDVLKKYAYVYKYDNRGNQIYRRLPGCEPILMVYDTTNVLVMSQTGNQRRKGTYWTVYKYDTLRRLIYTAEVNTRSNDHEELMESFSQWYVVEQFSTSSMDHPMANTGYSRGYYHIQPTELLTVNYYDTYDFLSFVADENQNNMAFVGFDGNHTSANTKGLLTGTRTYCLDGSGDYSETVYYYDYRGREIQRRTTNHLGGYDVLSTKYDFVNNVTDTWSSQSTNNGLTTTEHYHYTYDHANRPLTTTYTFNNESPIVLQSYNYDELGRVRSRHIHSGIDSVTFAYDIRNQVTQIKSSGYEQNYYYTQTFPVRNELVQKAYNGNIAATTWTYGNKTNGYMYYYDEINRLQSTYGILDNQWCESLYSELYQYDAHGNITYFMRFDDVDLVDDMFTIYNGNQLIEVEDDYDSQNYSSKEYHDNNDTGNDFAYDANGNMIYDKDRGIAAINYNLLNLPDEIRFTNGNLIIHRYDATGNRLETRYLTPKIPTTVPLGKVLPSLIFPGSFHITRDVFHNNIVYNVDTNDVYGIKFVHNPEGYIRYNNMNEHYHFYYIKDLLGNIRETYKIPNAGTKECVQRMQYYPSGLPWAESAGASEQPWKYNGKEFVEMHGLDEYDSKARWYYPAICRTTTMDPLAEKYYSTSPYAWCGNNPIKNVDLDGKEWLDIDGNQIDEHSNIQAYIFYNSKEFGEQSYVMAQVLEKKYGAGTVALSSAITEDEFAQDWINMSGVNIQEVNINHHGSNQAIHLDYINNEYITSTGTGYTQSGKAKAKNVTDLGIPLGDIQNATLYLNTCHSNSSGSRLGNIRFGENRIRGTSATLVGSKETIMQSFFNNYNFKKVRGTAAGVSYNRITREPEPQFFFQRWTIFER